MLNEMIDYKKTYKVKRKKGEMTIKKFTFMEMIALIKIRNYINGDDKA